MICILDAENIVQSGVLGDSVQIFSLQKANFVHILKFSSETNNTSSARRLTATELMFSLNFK